MILHEGFCLKNNVLCQECKEPVVKTELEKHMEEHRKEKEQKEKFQRIIEENKRKKLEEENKKKKEEEEKRKKLEEERKEEERKKKLEQENIKKKSLEDTKQKKQNVEQNNKKVINNSTNLHNKQQINNKKNNLNNSKNPQIKKKTNLVAIGYNPNNNDNLFNKDIKNEGMTVGEYWKQFGDNPPPQRREVKRTPVPRRKVEIDKSLGCKLCEYCSNYVDNISKHYLECQTKKINRSRK